MRKCGRSLPIARIDSFALWWQTTDSSDASLEILEELSRRDPDTKILANRANYGPEASVVNALEIAESLVTA